jgi:hypothetical protein
LCLDFGLSGRLIFAISSVMLKSMGQYGRGEAPLKPSVALVVSQFEI